MRRGEMRVCVWVWEQHTGDHDSYVDDATFNAARKFRAAHV